MTTGEAWKVDLAENVAGHGAFGTASELLRGAPGGRRANNLREQVKGASSLSPGIYGVLVHEQRGYVVPVTLDRRSPDSLVSQHGRALEHALFAARRALKWASLPPFRLELERWVMPEGDSLGAAALLAAVAEFTGAKLERAWIVSGALAPGGDIAAVTALEEKRGAVEREPAARDSEVVLAYEPSMPKLTADALLACVFGDVARLNVTGQVAALEKDLELARGTRDHLRACELLHALLRQQPLPGDAIRVHLDLGTRYRHLGRMAEARCHHDAAYQTWSAYKQSISTDTRLELHTQRAATARDEFQLETAEEEIRKIREALGADGSVIPASADIQLLGTLAQVASMGGQFDRAIDLRIQALTLHRLSRALEQDEAQTLCNLALDEARRGNPGAFDQYVKALFHLASRQEEFQRLYSFAALLRGLALLGRWEEFITVLEEGKFEDVSLPAALRLLSPVPVAVSDPHLGVARAAVRCLRKLGRTGEALELAARVSTDGPPSFVQWLAVLVLGEKALALRETGRPGEAEVTLEDMRARLARAEPRATEFYKSLLRCGWVTLESELDRSWY